MRRQVPSDNATCFFRFLATFARPGHITCIDLIRRRDEDQTRDNQQGQDRPAAAQHAFQHRGHPRPQRRATARAVRHGARRGCRAGLLGAGRAARAMVLRVCRARIGNSHDALDAFQATFLVLIRKSRGLWVKNSLGPWLHQVAFRTASCARSAAVRRRRAEKTAAELSATCGTIESETNSGWEQSLHEEINRLPERHRAAIVLCDLKGHTCEEAARRLGRPVGTVKSWRARGREQLRQRLIRSGLTLPAGAGLTASASSRAGDSPGARGSGRRPISFRYSGRRGGPGGRAIACQRSFQGHDVEQATDGGSHDSGSDSHHRRSRNRNAGCRGRPQGTWRTGSNGASSPGDGVESCYLSAR